VKEGLRMTKKGDKVKVHYTGKLRDGTLFDSSEGREPLEFTLGEGSMIRGFENAVYELEVGQAKTVTVPSAEAYGPRKDGLVMTFDRTQLPPGMSPKVGDQLQMQTPSGGAAVVTVSATSEKSITVDANHPLAGKDLTFEIRLVEVKSPG
jgi:peptidylprolyl isomerase